MFDFLVSMLMLLQILWVGTITMMSKSDATLVQCRRTCLFGAHLCCSRVTQPQAWLQSL